MRNGLLIGLVIGASLLSVFSKLIKINCDHLADLNVWKSRNFFTRSDELGSCNLYEA